MTNRLRNKKSSHWGQPLGLDELMIVNPSPAGEDTLYLGEDGALYQYQSSGETETVRKLGQCIHGNERMPFLSKCVTTPVAESHEFASKYPVGNLGRFFLGDDGTLYERVR